MLSTLNPKQEYKNKAPAGKFANSFGKVNYHWLPFCSNAHLVFLIQMVQLVDCVHVKVGFYCYMEAKVAILTLVVAVAVIVVAVVAVVVVVVVVVVVLVLAERTLVHFGSLLVDWRMV